MDDKAEDRELLRVAEAITDGKPVDWEKEHSAHRDLGRKFWHLRMIEKVAAAHQAPAQAEGAGAISAISVSVEESTHTVGPRGAETPSATRPATWGPLRILEILGRGGFGEVYRAYDPALQREVALKLRRADREGRGRSNRVFLQEAREIARIRHPNVLVIHGADEHEGRVGLWTDLVRGKTLELILSEQGPHGADEASRYGIEVCKALAAVHAAGLVHRDVKAANIMREQGGRIVLMDFGSATEQAGPGSVFGASDASGTPLYMSPEQLRGEDLTPATDIYSLGVVLYRLASGRFPMEAATFSELLEKHRQGSSVPLRDVRPDLPASFVQVVERALSMDPQKRFGSAGAMEQALAASLGAPVTAGTVEVKSGEFKQEREYGWKFWLPTAAALALAVVGGVFVARLLHPPAPFSAEATLFRKGNGTEERLQPGARIEPGDGLFLEIEGPEKMYVYVVNEDQMGNAFVLFPAGLDKENPLATGVRHRLPGRRAGVEMTWAVSSAGGREDFLVVASRTPLPELERDLARLPRVEEGREFASAPVSPETMRTLRGIGGLMKERPSPGTGGEPRLPGITRNLSAGPENRDGIWTWRIQLDNPAN